MRENSLTQWGADEGVGVLRLRMRIHKANPHASLRMTTLKHVDVAKSCFMLLSMRNTRTLSVTLPPEMLKRAPIHFQAGEPHHE
jgi:hypothetical protein